MKKYICSYILIGVIGIMLSVGLAATAQADSEVDVRIDVESSFGAGEQIFFTYTFSSAERQGVVYTPHIDCPMAPVAFLETKTVTVEKDVPFEGTYYGIKVTENLEPQTCAASIYVSQPIEQKFEKQFEIDVKPSFNFHIFACKDAACKERTRFYLIGESFYLGYDVDIEEPEISAKLKKPDNTEMPVALGKATVVEQEGKYILEAAGSKHGYKTMQDNIELVVVNEFTESIDTRICNVNGICEPNLAENFQNCPEDCPSSANESSTAKQKKKSIHFIFFLVIPILAIIALAGCLISKLKSRQITNV